jgi:hypothetical protein
MMTTSETTKTNTEVKSGVWSQAGTPPKRFVSTPDFLLVKSLIAAFVTRPVLAD